MKSFWKKLLAQAICVSMCLPVLQGMEVNATEKNNIEVVYSSYNDLEMEYALEDMTSEKNLVFQAQTQGTSEASVDIVVNPSITYQTWEGFGGSMDGATVYKILSLDETDQEAVMQDLFNTETGNGYNLMRLSIGCSDFTIDSPGTNGLAYYADKNAGSGYWTYADGVDEDTNGDGLNDSDMDLSGFSIQKDIANGQIGLLKKAMEINPDVEFFASMWSAPAWMKKNQDISWFEGQVDPELRDDCYEVLAEYYCKYIEAYKEQGITIKAVTLQNEPDIKIGYPCMMFTPENQIKFAKCLSEAFDAHGIDVEVWGLDANEFRTWEYAVPLLESEVGDAIDGIGYHNYGGLPMSYPNSLHESFPDKSFHITEMTVGGAKLVEYMRNWINSYAYWITYYDIDMENRTYGPGPSFWSKPQSTDADHWSLSQVADDGMGSYRLTAKYNTFGQFSRYIDKGAVRIASSESEGNISNVAFQNPDGSIAVVVVNRSVAVNGTNVVANTPDQKICINTPSGIFYDTLPGDTIVTYSWSPTTGDWIDKTNWSINVSDEDNRYSSYQAIDNSVSSFYFTGTEQSAGQYVELNLGDAERFDKVVLFQADAFASDYPGKYKLLVSDDGEEWNEMLSNQTGSHSITNIELDEIYEAQYIRIELVDSRNAWWNISDIAVFCSDIDSSIHRETSYERLDTKEQWTVEACTNRYTEDYANEVVDGNHNSEWIYQQAQKDGFYLIIDLGKEQTFEGVSVDFGETTDYARAFQLYTSTDKEQWEMFGRTQIVDGTVRNEANHVISSIIESESTARFIKMELTESVSDHWLRINEISLLTSETSVLWNNRQSWNVDASVNAEYAHLMLNGSSEGENNRWANGTEQIVGQYVLLDMGEEIVFNTISIESQNDYARGYNVKLLNSLDENAVETEIYSGPGEPGTQILSFDETFSSRYLKIELTEAFATSYWSIYELNIGIDNQVEYEYLTSDYWTAVTSNHGIALEKYAIDNSLNSVWTNGENQEQGTTTYLINLGEPQTICGIAITNGSEMWSYLEDYEVYAWCDGEEAKLVAKTEGKMSTTQLYFEPQMAKYLWIKAGTTSTANRQFAIADINVYTRRVNGEQ